MSHYTLFWFALSPLLSPPFAVLCLSIFTLCPLLFSCLLCDKVSWRDVNKCLFIADREQTTDKRHNVCHPTLVWWTSELMGHLQELGEEVLTGWPEGRFITKNPAPAWVMTHKSCILGACGNTCRQLGHHGLFSPASCLRFYNCGEGPWCL